MNITIDPHDKFNGAPESRILEACGLIPMWVADWIRSPTQKTLKEYLDDVYGFGLYEMTGGRIDDNGAYHYPDDPTLYPLIQIETDEGTFFMYEYSIVAIPTVNGYFITRMD